MHTLNCIKWGLKTIGKVSRKAGDASQVQTSVLLLRCSLVGHRKQCSPGQTPVSRRELGQQALDLHAAVLSNSNVA